MPGYLSAALQDNKDITGFKEVQLGEYPQSAADRELARTLEQDFSEGRLRKTGKKYQRNTKNISETVTIHQSYLYGGTHSLAV